MATSAQAILVEPALEWGPEDAPLAVLALHGRGQGPDFIEQLRARIGLDRLRWLVPTANRNSWYSHRFMDDQLPHSDELASAFAAVDELFAQLQAEGYSPDRIVLLGFSQGACLLSHWVLHHPDRFAGLILFTGGYIGPAGTRPPVDGDFDGTPVLISGPENDMWVPLSRMQETEALLRRNDANVTSLFIPPGEHSVTDAEVTISRTLLDRVLLRIS